MEGRFSMLKMLLLLFAIFALASPHCIEPTTDASYNCPSPISLVRNMADDLPLCAIIYEDINCKGDFHEISNGMAITNLKSLDFNDEISSLAVREGCTLSLYQHADFKTP